MIQNVVTSRPAMVGGIGWPSGRRTIIVKIPLLLEGSTFTWVPKAVPLSLDVVGGAGEVVYPSDFVPFKPRCDVIVLGETAEARSTSAALALGTWRTRAAEQEALGPRDTFCIGGDPTSREAIAVWAQPGFDFTRFQAAPPERRTSWPVSPFWVEYARGEVRMAGAVKVASPRAMIISGAKRALIERIALVLDTVLIDPSRVALSLVFRGTYDRPSSCDQELMAIDLEDTPTMDPRATVRWLPAKVATPASAGTPVERLFARGRRDRGDACWFCGDRPCASLPFVFAAKLACPAELAATGLGGRDEACGPLEGRHPPVSSWEGRVRAARDDRDGSGGSSFSR